MKIEKRVYKDHEGNEVTEHTHRGMRLRVVTGNGISFFNYDDLNTLWDYDGDNVFDFLYAVMGDELWNYLHLEKLEECV